MGAQDKISVFDIQFDLECKIEKRRRILRVIGDGWWTDWVPMAKAGQELQPLVEAAASVKFIDDGSFQVQVQRLHVRNFRLGKNAAGQDYPTKEEA